MEPNIHINFIAILIAVAANFILGFLWYTPIFGKLWAKEMGFNSDNKPPASAMIKGMVFMVIGNFLMAWVLAHNIAVWNPETWNQPASEMMTPGFSATMSAIFTWLGFYLPVDLGAVAWESKSWKLFFINTGYHLASLFVVSMIVTFMS